MDAYHAVAERRAQDPVYMAWAGATVAAMDTMSYREIEEANPDTLTFGMATMMGLQDLKKYYYTVENNGPSELATGYLQNAVINGASFVGIAPCARWRFAARCCPEATWGAGRWARRRFVAARTRRPRLDSIVESEAAPLVESGVADTMCISAYDEEAAIAAWEGEGGALAPTTPAMGEGHMPVTGSQWYESFSARYGAENVNWSRLPAYTGGKTSGVLATSVGDIDLVSGWVWPGCVHAAGCCWFQHHHAKPC